jgi:hypothetical protein
MFCGALAARWQRRAVAVHLCAHQAGDQVVVNASSRGLARALLTKTETREQFCATRVAVDASMSRSRRHSAVLVSLIRIHTLARQQRDDASGAI